MRDPRATIEYDSYDKTWVSWVEFYYESGQVWEMFGYTHSHATAMEAAIAAAETIQAHVDETEKEKQK